MTDDNKVPRSVHFRPCKIDQRPVKIVRRPTPYHEAAMFLFKELVVNTQGRFPSVSLAFICYFHLTNFKLF